MKSFHILSAIYTFDHKMDVSSALSVFQTGTAKIGKNVINTSFFDLDVKDMLNVLKSGYHHFSNDLAILVSSLMGKGSAKIIKQIEALKKFSVGKLSLFEKDIFDDLNIACIRVDSRDPIFSNIGIPIVVLSIDGGETWTGMIKTRCRTAPIQTWVSMYYTGLLDSIKFKPSAEFFLHDFRYISVCRPYGDRFVTTKLFIADRRDMESIKESCIFAYKSVPDLVDESSRLYNNRSLTRVPSPPLPPPHRYRLAKNSSSKPDKINSPPRKISSPRKSPKRSPQYQLEEKSPKRERKE